MARMLLVLADGEQLHLTRHALERWREYVCPTRPAYWARDFLQLVVALAGREAPAPAWVNRELGSVASRYIVAGDFALALIRGEDGLTYVRTVIPRGGVPHSERAARNDAAAAERRSRAARRRTSAREDRASRARRRELRAPEPDPSDAYTDANDRGSR